MYNHSSFLIVGILCIVLLVAIEVGFRLGMRHGREANEATRSQVNTIQASLLGVLALLLGFTFSLSLQRFDSRSAAVVNEANAIGTAWLRSELLPASVRSDVRAAMQQYIAARVAAGEESLDHVERRADLLAQTEVIQEDLWSLVVRAADEAPNPVTTGLYTQALNEMIDAFGVRQAALDRHVPEIVLFLLLGTLTLTASLVGYASGMAGQRASFATHVLVLLIVLLVFIIIDLDRPRRGLIEVRQDSMVTLRDAMTAAQPAER